MALGYYKNGAWNGIGASEADWAANNIGLDSLVPGLYYTTGVSTSATAGGATDFLRAVPYYNAATVQYDRIAVHVINSAVDGLIRLGIYKIEGGIPTSLVVDAGEVDASTNGVKEATISTTLRPGWYALALNRQNNTTLRGYQPQNRFQVGSSDIAVSNQPSMWQRPVAYGALPDPFGSASRLAWTYMIALRAA